MLKLLKQNLLLKKAPEEENTKEVWICLVILFYFILFYFILLVFRAALSAYGGSHARGQIGATAIAMQDWSRVCDLHHSSWQCRILKSTDQCQGSNPQPHGY